MLSVTNQLVADDTDILLLCLRFCNDIDSNIYIQRSSKSRIRLINVKKVGICNRERGMHLTDWHAFVYRMRHSKFIFWPWKLEISDWEQEIPRCFCQIWSSMDCSRRSFWHTTIIHLPPLLLVVYNLWCKWSTLWVIQSQERSCSFWRAPTLQWLPPAVFVTKEPTTRTTKQQYGNTVWKSYLG